MKLLSFSISKRIIILFIFCLNVYCAFSQKGYTVANAHAHNDYLHPVPFYTAYNAGFGSIEVDVFPVNGVLLVAHHKKEIQAERSLKELYIHPLLKVLPADSSRRLILLVDMKEDHKLSLSLLIKELEPLKPYLSTSDRTRPLAIVITGLRPPPENYNNYPDFIFFDDDLKLRHSSQQWNRVRLVSLPFNKISIWKGEDKINKNDKKRLRHKIDSVHSAGKPIRFWAAPDTEASWKLQMKLHADLIGTDKIEVFTNYLHRNSK